MAELDFTGFFDHLRALKAKALRKKESADIKAKLETLFSRHTLAAHLKKLCKDDFLYGEMFGQDRMWLREKCVHCNTQNVLPLGRHPDYDSEFFVCHKCKQSSKIEGALSTGITRRGADTFANYVDLKGVDG